LRAICGPKELYEKSGAYFNSYGLLAILIVALLSAPALAATAGFVKTDTTTMGGWIGAYGADGYFVSQDSNTKTPWLRHGHLSGQANWTWAASTTALPALQNPRTRATALPELGLCGAVSQSM